MTITRQVKQVFDTHKEVNSFFFTVDYQAFFNAKEAGTHAGNLKDKTVTEITRAQLDAWWPGEVSATMQQAQGTLTAANKALEAANAILAGVPVRSSVAQRKAAYGAVNKAKANVNEANKALNAANVEMESIKDKAALNAAKEKLEADSKAGNVDVNVINTDAAAVAEAEAKVANE